MGLSCGTCPEDELCGGDGRCFRCVPDCVGKECGDDGCGATCGDCANGIVCDDGTCH